MAGCKIDFLCTLRIPQIILRLWGFLHVCVRDAGHRGNKITENLFPFWSKVPVMACFCLHCEVPETSKPHSTEGNFTLDPPSPGIFILEGAWQNATGTIGKKASGLLSFFECSEQVSIFVCFFFYVFLHLHQEAKQILNVQDLDPEVIQKVFEWTDLYKIVLQVKIIIINYIQVKIFQPRLFLNFLCLLSPIRPGYK